MMYDDKTVERFNQIQDWQGCIAIDLGRSATSSPSPPAEERAGERRPFVRGFLKSMAVGVPLGFTAAIHDSGKEKVKKR
jgi:hypothetical protein